MFQLCYITDRKGLAPESLLPRIEVAAEAGVDLIHLREKDLPSRQLAELAGAAVRICRKTGTRIVVNDRLDVAKAVGADGVHLGGQSMPAEVVRRATGKDFLIGGSCHSLSEALEAEAAGADYILLGPIYETPSKLRYGPPLSLAKLAEVTQRIRIPVLALGGITVARVAECIAAGAIGVAGIRIFQDCSSVEEKVRELRAQFRQSDGN